MSQTCFEGWVEFLNFISKETKHEIAVWRRRMASTYHPSPAFHFKSHINFADTNRGYQTKSFHC